MHRRTHAHTHAHSHTCTHTYAHSHAHTHMRAHTHLHTHIHIRTCTHTYIHTHAHTYKHTHIQTHTHTLIHAHTHVRAHTHTHMGNESYQKLLHFLLIFILQFCCNFFFISLVNWSILFHFLRHDFLKIRFFLVMTKLILMFLLCCPVLYSFSVSSLPYSEINSANSFLVIC